MKIFETFTKLLQISATYQDLTRFHSEDYINYLSNDLNEDNITYEDKLLGKKFSIGTNERDCPIFDNLYTFCCKSTAGSLASANLINSKSTDICINWAGGFHHAKKSEASGFCYVNDIVIGILELLKHHKRVLYIDIDVHHGDGVEEAFYTTDRVMTVSFHRFGKDFFPCTGGLTDIGASTGKYFSVNVPLKAGINDESYNYLFTPIIARVFEVYQPSVVVLQCGADSLTGDRLGDFNLTLRGHGDCVKFLRSFNVPLILLGGGGYTPKNVSKCWTYETSIALNIDIPDDLPYNDYFNYFEGDLKLHINANPKKVNKNSQKYLDSLLHKTFDNLTNVMISPSVEFTPINQSSLSDDILEFDSPDQSTEGEQIMPDNEFYD